MYVWPAARLHGAGSSRPGPVACRHRRATVREAQIYDTYMSMSTYGDPRCVCWEGEGYACTGGVALYCDLGGDLSSWHTNPRVPVVGRCIPHFLLCLVSRVLR